jgi:hypothetical protein
MRKLRTQMITVLALALLGAQPTAESLLDKEMGELTERLEDGGVVVLEDTEGEGTSFVIAYVLFERPLADVQALMRQAERQPEYRPELESVETVRKFEGGRIDEQRLKILFKRLTYRLRYEMDPVTGRVEWALDPDFDNDARTIEGFWELNEFADGERTLGRFGSNVDVGAGVPKFVQKRMSRKTVLRYIGNFRRWVESDGEWRP